MKQRIELLPPLNPPPIIPGREVFGPRHLGGCLLAQAELKYSKEESLYETVFGRLWGS
ncbi:MAG: hypothetical protein ABJ327_18030 [Litoreibacter sp.]